MKKYLPIIILISCFLLLKLSTLGIRISDTNVYFYTAYDLLRGRLLYKDVFFTNFPLFPYISSLYLLISGKQLLFYYSTAALESAATGFLIYLIVLKQTKKQLLGTVSAALYLFSFILLATTDHQTGVFLASLFAVASYYFFTEKKLLLTGIFIALALMTKAYFLPIFLTYAVLAGKEGWERKGSRGEGIKKTPVISRSEATRNPGIPRLWRGSPRATHFIRNDMVLFLIGFTATVGVILLPTFLFARQDFFRDVFAYSLTRSQGLSKVNILRFFVFHDLPLFASFLYSLVMIRKHLFFGVLSIFSLLFIIFYKDIYYLYLNFLVPFLCLAAVPLYQTIQKRIQVQVMILPTVITVFLLVNLGIYWTNYRTLAKVEHIDVLVNAIKQAHPPSLYGENGITAALAYLSDTPLMYKRVDLNPNIFNKGYLNATELTKQALAEHSLIVAQGIYYPEYGVRQDATDGTYDVKLMKNCRIIQALPVKTEGYQNRINLIRCQ